MQRRNRIWIWFFVLLAVLSAAAVYINYAYNKGQQLTAEALKAARAKWDAHGPADYDLHVHKDISSAASDKAEADDIDAVVRSKRVVEVRLNGRPLEERLWPKYDIPSWFDYIEEFLERDRDKEIRVFCVLDADPNDGHPLRYVRRVSGTRERQELRFELKPVQGVAPAK